MATPSSSRLNQSDFWTLKMKASKLLFLKTAIKDSFKTGQKLM
jgi:hypothetical protein